MIAATLIRGFGTAAIVFSTHYAEDRIGEQYGTKPASGKCALFLFEVNREQGGGRTTCNSNVCF